MCVPTSELPDAELLQLVSAISTPTGLTLSDVAAAGRSAWTWRGFDEQLDAILRDAYEAGPD